MYATLKQLKNSLKIDQTDTSRDEYLLDLLRRVSGYIDEYVGRSFGGASSVTNELYDLPSDGMLFLRHGDIVSVEAVTVVDRFGVVSPQSLQAGSGFSFSPTGRLLLNFILNPWATVPSRYAAYDSVRVSYTYGSSTVPAGITNAALDIAMGLARDSASGGAIKQERIGDYHITYQDAVTSAGSQFQALDRYRVRHV